MFPQVRRTCFNLNNDNRTQVERSLESSIIIKVTLLKGVVMPSYKTKTNIIVLTCFLWQCLLECTLEKTWVRGRRLPLTELFDFPISFHSTYKFFLQL